MNEPETYDGHGASGEAALSAPAAPSLRAEAEPSDPPEPRRSGYRQLEDVITDESFPEVDLALRRGRHIHKGDERWYEFLTDAQSFLETFYRRYGCELEQRSDGYFFLLPLTDGLGKRHLGVPEMIVGQGLALCFLDPSSVQSGGVITREELLNQLASVMGTDALMQTLNPKRKRADERVMQRTVRLKVAEALRKLAQLGFVELVDAEQLRLWPSLMRFAEPVRGLDAPSEALKRLIERGEVSLGPGDEEPAEADAAVEADAELELVADTELDVPGMKSAAAAAGVTAAVAADSGAASASVAAAGSEAFAWIEDESAAAADDAEAAEAAEAHEGAEPGGADAGAWAEAAAVSDFEAEAEAEALNDFEAEAEAEAEALGDFEAEAEAAVLGHVDAEAEAMALRGFEAEAEAEADAAALGGFDAEAEPMALPGFEAEPPAYGSAEPELELGLEEPAPAVPAAPDAPAAEDDATVVPADLEIEWDTVPGEKA
jgi:chromosome partition protein MukE